MGEGPVIVYLGPSLGRREARGLLDADYRPPVRHGDVWRALREEPVAIGIVDGAFEQTPAVWHKEILEALAGGVHVFGGASMGALRAAELHAFGMRGIGRIFEAYRDGDWTDDDEVAIVHGPAEAGWATLNLPMANVRATVEAACAAGALDIAEAEAVTAGAKAVFYARRDWEASVAAAGLAAHRVAPALSWLKENSVDQKRADARAMLTEMRHFLAAPTERSAPGFTLERTDLAAHARAIALAS